MSHAHTHTCTHTQIHTHVPTHLSVRRHGGKTDIKRVRQLTSKSVVWDMYKLLLVDHFAINTSTVWWVPVHGRCGCGVCVWVYGCWWGVCVGVGGGCVWVLVWGVYRCWCGVCVGVGVGCVWVLVWGVYGCSI